MIRHKSLRAIIDREYTHLIPFERLLPSYKIFPTKAAIVATGGDVWSDISAIGLFDVCLGAVEISGWLGPQRGAGCWLWARPLSHSLRKSSNCV